LQVARCKLTLPADGPHIHHTHTHTHTHNQSPKNAPKFVNLPANDMHRRHRWVLEAGGGWRAKYLKVCNTRRALHDADVPMSQLFRQSSSLHSSTVHRGLWNRKSRRAGQKAELCTRKSKFLNLLKLNNNIIRILFIPISSENFN